MTELVNTNVETVDGYMKPILKAPLGGSEMIDMNQARIVAASYAAAGAVLGSVIGRKRQAAGKDPVLKVFF